MDNESEQKKKEKENRWWNTSGHTSCFFISRIFFIFVVVPIGTHIHTKLNCVTYDSVRIERKKVKSGNLRNKKPKWCLTIFFACFNWLSSHNHHYYVY